MAKKKFESRFSPGDRVKTRSLVHFTIEYVFITQETYVLDRAINLAGTLLTQVPISIGDLIFKKI